MENLKELLAGENKQIENGGQMYFDSHGIYCWVSSTIEKMPHEKFYLEKFRQMKLNKKESGNFDLLGFEDLRWQRPYQWEKKDLDFIFKSNNSEVKNFTWIMVLVFTGICWFLVVCGLLFWL